jgi:hypothetical protein
MRVEPFEQNVFINCPFDDSYKPLLRPLLFTIVDLGFRPRIALERSDSGESRIDKICSLIRASRYSIHDISRLRAEASDELYRLNMAFELGIDYGSRRLLDEPRLTSKRFLVLGRERGESVQAFSDISGLDIKTHKNKPTEVVRAVRNWFVETVKLKGVPSPTQIWYRFTDFADDFYDARREDGFTDEDLNMMPVPEYVDFIEEWVRGA